MPKGHTTAFVALATTVALLASACGGSSDPEIPPSGTKGSGDLDFGNAETVAADRAGAPNPSSVPPEVTAACAPEKSPTISAIKKAGALAWGIGISPPFGFTGSSSRWQGVDAESAVELAGILGVKPNIVAYDYSVMTTALQSGKADIVGAQLFDTPERRQAIDFSVPYYKSGQVYYVLKDSRFQTIEDLDSPAVKFVFGTGTAQGDLAKKYSPKAKQQAVALQGQLIPYQFLSTGRADASMGEAAAYPVLKQKFRNPPLAAIGKNGRVATSLPTAGESLDPFDVAFGLPKGDAGWKGCVDAWVTWGSQDGGLIAERVDWWLTNQTKAGG